MPMELRHLRSFYEVASQRSFTRAAQSLHLTQPAVTQHVQSLEAKWGTPLLERLGRDIQMTAAGAVVMEYAERILRLVEECERAVEEVRTGMGGRIRIGAGATTSIVTLPEILGQLRAARPGIEVVVQIGDTAAVVDMVLHNRVDVGLVTSPVNHSELKVVSLFEEELTLLVYPSHPLAQRGAATLAQVSQEPLILFPPTSGFRNDIDHLFSAAGLSIRPTMELESLEAIKKLVEIGLGVSIIPRGSAPDEIASGTLIPVALSDAPPLTRQTRLIHRRDKYLSASIQAFLEILQDRFGAAGGSPLAQDPS